MIIMHFFLLKLRFWPLYDTTKAWRWVQFESLVRWACRARRHGTIFRGGILKHCAAAVRPTTTTTTIKCAAEPTAKRMRCANDGPSPVLCSPPTMTCSVLKFKWHNGQNPKTILLFFFWILLSWHCLGLINLILFFSLFFSVGK